MFRQLLDYLFEMIIAFATQQALVLAIVAWIKEVTGLKGWPIRVISMVVGLIPGALFYWVFLDSVPNLLLSNKVLIGFLFLAAAGMSASGFYDLGFDFRLKKNG